MTITSVSIEYDAINSKKTFSNGDIINGRIIVEASEKTKIKSLIFIAQGGARVRWTQLNQSFKSMELFYDIRRDILREARQDGTNIIDKGKHVFPFSFTVPNRKMPSTAELRWGSIFYRFEAELELSKRAIKRGTTYFTFKSKDIDIPGLMDPQHGYKDKSFKVFGSGFISMDVETKRMGYKPGEALQVTVEVNNQSQRSVKPTFKLCEKDTYFAMDIRRIYVSNIVKEKMETVAPSSKVTLTVMFIVPKDVYPSLECSIMRRDFSIVVNMGLTHASDTEVDLPIIILPASEHQVAPQ